MADGNHLAELSGWRVERPETGCNSPGDSPSPAGRAGKQPPATQMQKKRALGTPLEKVQQFMFCPVCFALPISTQ